MLAALIFMTLIATLGASGVAGSPLTALPYYLALVSLVGLLGIELATESLRGAWLKKLLPRFVSSEAIPPIRKRRFYLGFFLFAWGVVYIALIFAVGDPDSHEILAGLFFWPMALILSPAFLLAETLIRRKRTW